MRYQVNHIESVCIHQFYQIPEYLNFLNTTLPQIARLFRSTSMKDQLLEFVLSCGHMNTYL